MCQSAGRMVEYQAYNNRPVALFARVSCWSYPDAMQSADLYRTCCLLFLKLECLYSEELCGDMKESERR